MNSHFIFKIFASAILVLIVTTEYFAAAFPPTVSPGRVKDHRTQKAVQSNLIQDLFHITEEDITLSTCQNCTRNNAPAYNRLNEKIKSRILSALRLKKVPKKKSLPEIQPLKFSGNCDENTNEPISIDTDGLESATMFSQSSETRCSEDRSKPCIRFQIKLPKRITADNLHSTVLWMYKSRGVTSLEVKQRVFNYRTKSMRFESTVVCKQEHHQGWLRFDAQEVLSNLFDYKNHIIDLEISSGTSRAPLEIEEKKQPFLIVNMNTRSNRRTLSKRSVEECEDENSTCCKQRYYVNFRDIGWDDWIVEPKGYWANFCRGSCRHEIGYARDLHSTVLILLLSTNASEARRVGINVNCVPKALRSMPIIHAGEDGVEVNMHVPNMIVEECACA